MTPLDNSPDPVHLPPRGYGTGYVVEDHGTARVGRLTVAPDPGRAAVDSAIERVRALERDRVLKLRFIKKPDTQRIVKCEVFDADTREVVGELYVSDVKMLYPANGGHPEARVRLISAWEDAYE